MIARLHRIIAVALLSLVTAGLAQPSRAESVFGLNLLGERMYVGDARGAALGGFVQILDDSLAVLQYNPAAVSWCGKVTFGVSGYVTRDKNRSADASEKTVSTKLTGFMFALPLYRKSLSFALGYRGRYDPDGNFSVRHETSEGEVYFDRFERSGGLWSVPFILAARVGNSVRIGGYYSLERGHITNRWAVDFQGPSTADALSTQENEFSASGWGGGVMLRPVPRVSLGVTYDAAIDYDVATKELFTNTSANTAYDQPVSLPARWTGSLAVRLGKFTAHVGGAVSDFTKFRGLAFPVERLAKEQVASAGVEYSHSPGALPIRVSATLEQLPYTMPDGENIRRVAFSLGTGLLFKSRTGKLDTALQFGKTGSVGTNGYDDQFVRFFLSITGSEEWKRRRETRY